MLENKNNSGTPIASLGEFGLIDHLTEHFNLKNKRTIKGVGDDAAVLDTNDKQTLITTDMLVEGVHFDLAYVPLKHLGYKAVMVNLSDIYAMNGEAEQITVSVAVSNRFPVEALEELYSGIKTACELYEVDLIGGDTTSSNLGLVISITAIGSATSADVVKRSTANPTDLIAVTGDLGSAYMGLQILEREKEVWKVNPASQPDLESYQYIIERQLKPEARKDIVKLLKELEVKPSSMIDISDGLSSEILHLCRQSGLGCSVYEEKIPKDPQMMTTCDEFNLDSTTVALNGGEDYELLFTFPLSDYDKIKGNPNITVIGHMTGKDEEAYLTTKAETQIPITAQGWDALLRKEKSTKEKE